MASMDTLYVDASGAQSVAVHPVVLFSVLDHHIRRKEDQDRVIGALLGVTTAGGVVEVTDTIAINYSIVLNESTGNAIVEIKPLNDKLLLHKRVNEKETLVGWYSSWSADSAQAVAGGGVSDGTQPIDEMTAVVHNFFSDLMAKGPTASQSASLRPLHLLVDASLAQPRIGVHAYVAAGNALTATSLAVFQQLKVTVATSAEERVAIDAMAKAAFGKDGAGVGASGGGPLGEAREPVADLDTLESSMRRLHRMLDTVVGYVDDVTSGKRQGDEAIGRAIAEVMAAVPLVDSATFERTFTTGLQNLLMVTYLASLTQAQVKLAEKIATQVPERRP